MVFSFYFSNYGLYFMEGKLYRQSEAMKVGKPVAGKDGVEV